MAEVPMDFLQTRASLLSRLKNWQDREAWQQFFDIYWKLIYSVAVKAGLNEPEAREVVQDTLLTVAKKIQQFHYDPAAGRFRHWLLNVTRWKIAQQLRRQQREAQRAGGFVDIPSSCSNTRAELREALSVAPQMEAIWDAEWQGHVMGLALQRVKSRVKPKHYQVFDLYVLRQMPLLKVARLLRVNMAQVYLAKSRLSKLIKQELQALQAK